MSHGAGHATKRHESLARKQRLTGTEHASSMTVRRKCGALGLQLSHPVQAGGRQAKENLTMVETILLVEDDAPIRRLLSRALEHQGSQLLKASNGHEALGLLANHRGPIDLLVTDVVMPRMDGFTLSERLGESHPETRVLFLSGQADQSTAVRGGLRNGEQAFLLKPFTHSTLLHTIREQLDGGPGPCAPGRDQSAPDG